MRICCLIRSMPVTGFGDRMLDLDACVHLEQVEVLLAVDEELDGAGVGIAGGLGQAHGRGAQRLAHFGLQQGAGRLFDQFLVPALQRAVALPEVDDVAVVVRHDLHLDVPAEFDVLLDVDRGVLEGVLGFGLRLPQAGLEGDVVVGHAHPAPAAAGGGLDDDGVPDLVGDPQRLSSRRPPRRRCRARWGPSPSWQASWPATLSPRAAMAASGGPMNSILQLRQISAKCEFSARNP